MIARTPQNHRHPFGMSLTRSVICGFSGLQIPTLIASEFIKITDAVTDIEPEVLQSGFVFCPGEF